MKNALWVRLTLAAACVVLLAAVAAGCGSSGSSSSGSTAESTEAPAESTETGKASSADYVESAKQKVAPVVGHPSPFPVTEKLKELPEGATVDFMDCGLSYCSLFWELIQEPAEMLGLKLKRIKSGEDATTITNAFDSVVAEKPDAIIVMANSLQLWLSQLKELQEEGVVVVTQGITEGEKYGIVSPRSAENQNTYIGEMMANYIPAYMDPEANVVVYEVPELSFTTELAKAFVDNIKSACPKCSARIAQIPAASIGTKSSNEIVSDLQANPETNLGIFTDPELSVGLPSTLQTAGIEIEMLSNGPVPANLEQIKEGTEAAGFGVDTAVSSWMLVDQVARLLAGQELTGPQAEGLTVYQFLTKEDITFDPEKGWTGYPEYAERFAKLWGVPAPK